MDAAIKKQIELLFNLVADGTIEDDWESTFIDDINKMMKQGKELTVNQRMKVEELFERY